MLPAGPRNGEAVNPVIPRPERFGSLKEALQNTAVRLRIAHNTASSHIGAASLELRLDQSDDPAVRRSGGSEQRARRASRPMNETSIVTRSTRSGSDSR